MRAGGPRGGPHPKIVTALPSARIKFGVLAVESLHRSVSYVFVSLSISFKIS